jgi:hypothetical protein
VKRQPFHLVGTFGSTETIDCLEEWLADARKGDLIGISSVNIWRQRRFSLHTCGEAYRSPVFTRGCLAALDDELGLRIRAEIQR